MTPFGRLLRNAWERFRRRYYEGPDAPDRLADMVVEFAAAHPRATRRDWIDFAASMAAESYRSGYVRGYEWAERDLERRDPMVDPEVQAELEGHGWAWHDGAPLAEPSDLDAVVPEVEQVDEREDLAKYAEELPLGEIEQDPWRR